MVGLERATTNRLGRFTVTDVSPVLIRLMVKAPGLFAFYALQVAAENDVDAHLPRACDRLLRVHRRNRCQSHGKACQW